MHFRDPAMPRLLAPIFLTLLTLPDGNSVDVRRYKTKILRNMCRELEEFVVIGKSKAAQQLADQKGIGDLSHFRYSDRHKKSGLDDKLDGQFHFEHTVPVSILCKGLQALAPATEAAIEAIISKAQVTWVTSEENKRLNDLGFAHKRPDPADAYRRAGIELTEM